MLWSTVNLVKQPQHKLGGEPVWDKTGGSYDISFSQLHDPFKREGVLLYGLKKAKTKVLMAMHKIATKFLVG